MAQRGPNQARASNPIERQVIGDSAYGLASKNSRGMTNIADPMAAQNGYAVNYAGFVNSSNYTKRNVIPVLYEAPTGFDFLPNPEMWYKTLKSLVELQADSIEGLASTLEATFTETPIGRAGEIQQDVSNVTRTRTEPVFTFTEKEGRPIQTFFEGWIEGLLMNPETNVPNVMTQSGDKPTDLFPDVISMTCLFIEPDPTQTRVNNAWLCTNMMPQGAGENTGQSQLQAGAETVQHSITFTALTQRSLGVMNLAQMYLDEMNKASVNPNVASPMVDQIQAEINQSETGLLNQMDMRSRHSVVGASPDQVSEGVRDNYESVPGDSTNSNRQPNPQHSNTAYRDEGNPV